MISSDGSNILKNAYKPNTSYIAFYHLVNGASRCISHNTVLSQLEPGSCRLPILRQHLILQYRSLEHVLVTTMRSHPLLCIERACEKHLSNGISVLLRDNDWPVRALQALAQVVAINVLDNAIVNAREGSGLQLLVLEQICGLQNVHVCVHDTSTDSGSHVLSVIRFNVGVGDLLVVVDLERVGVPELDDLIHSEQGDRGGRPDIESITGVQRLSSLFPIAH